MARKIYHISKKNGVWQGKARGGQRASITASTKGEIVSRMAEIARNQNYSQIIIHKMNGQFQSERTYGRDPFPPKG